MFLKHAERSLTPAETLVRILFRVPLGQDYARPTAAAQARRRLIRSLRQKDFSMPAPLPARLKTWLFVHGLPARKCGSARPKPALGQTR